MKRESVKIWAGWLESMDNIPDRGSRAELALAIFEYALDGRDYTGSDPWVKVLLPTIKKTIDHSLQNAENGGKGGRRKAENLKAANSTATSTANSDATTTASSGASSTKDVDVDVDVDDNDNVNNRHKTKDYDFAADLLASGVPENYVNDFLQVRKKKRASNTRSAMEGLKNNAAKAGISLAYAVQLCAQHSWQSFDPKYVEGWRLDDKYKKNDADQTPITQRLDQFGQPIVDVDLN